MIKQNKNNFPIRMMCKILCVSSSGYYDWQDRKPSKRSEEKTQLTGDIKRIFDKDIFNFCNLKRLAWRK